MKSGLNIIYHLSTAILCFMNITLETHTPHFHFTQLRTKMKQNFDLPAH